MIKYEISRADLTKKNYNNYNMNIISQEAEQKKNTEAIAKILAQMIIDKQEELK